ncbi:GPI-anchored surface protein, putative, partial [Bodo saltans]
MRLCHQECEGPTRPLYIVRCTAQPAMWFLAWENKISGITMSDTRKLLTVLQCVDPKGLPFTEQLPDDCTEYTSLRVVRRQSPGMNDDIDNGRACSTSMKRHWSMETKAIYLKTKRTFSLMHNFPMTMKLRIRYLGAGGLAVCALS